MAPSHKSITFELFNFQPDILKLGFSWLGYSKPVSSFFVRTSPEFEIALYTLCFTARANTGCRVSLNGVSRSITTHTMSGINPPTVGSAYPAC